jgi:DNA modification methylase
MIQRRRAYTILTGDAREVLGTLADESVHCVVTSPPYWGLRDYGVGGQLGLEPTPELYVEHMVDVFREVRRVLRRDGTLWLNMGDCYANVSAGAGGKGKQWTNKGTTDDGIRSFRKDITGLKPKDLVGVPWRLAFALQADGWWLRSDIVWAKPNPMPESCRDRPTKAHEYVFLLTRSVKYYWDQEAVREPVKSTSGEVSVAPHGKHVLETGHRRQHVKKYDRICGANIRTVWTIPTQPFPEAHFATFPEALPERCIRAGTSERGCCPTCGAFWVRVVEKTRTFESGSGRAGNLPSGKNEPGLQGGGETGDVRRGPCVSSRTIGWEPSCDCTNIDAVQAWDVPEAAAQAPPHDPVPCVVLDPFVGSGTTAIVAVRLDRRAVGIDLSPEYTDMVERQLAVVTPGVGAKRPRKFKLKARRRL